MNQAFSKIWIIVILITFAAGGFLVWQHLKVAPEPVPEPKVLEVDGGSAYALAIKTDGTLWAWGYNSHGELGLGDTTDRHSPTKIVW